MSFSPGSFSSGSFSTIAQVIKKIIQWIKARLFAPQEIQVKMLYGVKWSIRSPVLVLHMDEGSGNIVHDESGYGNDGTIHGAAWVDGKYGKALSFDGVDDYVEITNPTTVRDQFTIMAWVKVNDTGARCIVGTRRPQEYGFDFKFQGGNVIHGDIGNGEYWITTSADIIFPYQLDTWYHIAYVVMRTGYSIYVNGELKRSESYSENSPLLSDSNHYIYIGKYGGDAEFFNGTIDEVRIYNRVLSQEEIKILMNGEVIGQKTAVRLYTPQEVKVKLRGVEE